MSLLETCGQICNFACIHDYFLVWQIIPTNVSNLGSILCVLFYRCWIPNPLLYLCPVWHWFSTLHEHIVSLHLFCMRNVCNDLHVCRFSSSCFAGHLWKPGRSMWESRLAFNGTLFCKKLQIYPYAIILSYASLSTNADRNKVADMLLRVLIILSVYIYLYLCFISVTENWLMACLIPTYGSKLHCIVDFPALYYRWWSFDVWWSISWFSTSVLDTRSL